MFSRLRVLASRVGGFFAGHRLDEDFQRELASHLDMLTEENIRGGPPPDEARRQASLRLGGAAQLRETQHDLRGLPWLETLLQDVRFGLRMLRKNPGFTAVVVLTLALGIGANAAIFSLVNAVLLRKLPVRNPARLVLFSDNSLESLSMSPGIPSGRQSYFSYPFYKYVRDNSEVFDGVCAFQTPEDTLTVSQEGKPGGAVSVAQGKMVSGNYFSVLGVRAILGRTLTPADDQPDAPSVTVISFNYWRRSLAADRTIIDKTLEIDGVPLTIVGV